MSVRGAGKRWWAAGAALGLGFVALGAFLVRSGLEDADRWASVIGVFLNIIGLTVAAYSIVQSRSPRPSQPGHSTRNVIIDAEVTGPTLMGRDMYGVALTDAPSTERRDPDKSLDNPMPAEPASGEVNNKIKGGTFVGPLIMGRDFHGITLPPASSPAPSANPGSEEADR
jgi:hypothetical protein